MLDENTRQIEIGDKKIIIVGTAHVSQKSVEEVKKIISEEKPDTVCIELDQQRYHAIVNKSQWQQMDIFKIIKEKKATFLLINLIISSFQKRIANQFNIRPGQEMIQAIESANEIGASLVLADRNIQTTFLRIWGGLGPKSKVQLVSNILLGLLNNEKITEEELEQLKSNDILTSLLDEFASSFPNLQKYLIGERDQYLAQKIKEAPGNKIVAVLGAAHVPGVAREIHKDHNLGKLNLLPRESKAKKVLSWVLSLLIISMIVSAYYFSRTLAIDLTYSWFFWNSFLSALGTAIGFGHPLSIVVSLIVSPISSLTPLLGAGWIVGLVEAFIRKPNVEDFEKLPQDIISLHGFWQNKITRVLLVTVLTGVGTAAGSIIGGISLVRIFIKAFSFI